MAAEYYIDKPDWIQGSGCEYAVYGRNRGRGRVALYLFKESRCQDARQVEDASEARIVVLVCFFPLFHA